VNLCHEKQLGSLYHHLLALSHSPGREPTIPRESPVPLSVCSHTCGQSSLPYGKVGDLTLIEEGCREPLRDDQALFHRGMMSGGEMDLAWGNKPVEVPDPEDSSTMEESVVTFSGQRHNPSAAARGA
jgi:hypothetical protein